MRYGGHPMDPKQTDHFRSMLLKQRDEIEADTLTHGVTPDQPTSGDRRDPGEESVFASEQIVENRLSGDYENLLRKIDHALERLDFGTYQTCENCGKEIPLERLEAKPSVSLCVPCQEEKDAAS